MCVIIIKQQTDKVIDQNILRSSARINPHGLGVTWLDTFKTEYHASVNYDVLETNRPFIAHFRYATVGSVNTHNMHPFVCGAQDNELLMMNGTIKGLGNKTDCDSRVLAGMLGELPRDTWKDILEEHECRFTTINTKARTFEIYNEDMWHTHDGIMYSKPNVLFTNTIAVYGTLKKGQSNHPRFLSRAEFLGSGITQDKYPLLIDGLPYLLPEKGTGHRVEMHVFRVTDEMLHDVDILEGHPRWYVREQIPVHLGSETHMAWTYFNPKHRQPSDEMHYTFPAPSPWDFEMAEDNELLPLEYGNAYYCLNCFNGVEKDNSAFDTYTCKTCSESFDEAELNQYKLF